MSDPTLTALRALAEDVGERAVPPPFDEVTARAGRRRRTRASLVAAAAVLVLGVAGAALWPGAPDPAPSPAPPASTESLPAAVSELVGHASAAPFEMVGGLDGSLAVIWRDLVHPEPTFALVVQDSDGSVSGRLLDEPLDLTAVPGGWVGSRDGQRASFVSPDGTVADLPVESTQARPGAGDWAVQLSGPRCCGSRAPACSCTRRWTGPRRSSWSRTRAGSSPTIPARRSSRPRRGRRSCSRRAPEPWSSRRTAATSRQRPWAMPRTVRSRRWSSWSPTTSATPGSGPPGSGPPARPRWSSRLPARR